MESNFYEERVPVNPFNLALMKDRTFGIEHPNIQIDEKNNSLLFLHIKTLNVSNMRLPYILPDNHITPYLCFITHEYQEVIDEETGEKTTVVARAIKGLCNTSIFDGNNLTSTLDKFVDIINSNIDQCVKLCKEETDEKQKVNSRLLYGNFSIEENKLQFKYKFERNVGQANRIAVLAFNEPFVDFILKYFDIKDVSTEHNTYYYINPAFQNRDISNDFKSVPDERTVTAFRDTTDFFFPTHKMFIEITNTDDPVFSSIEDGYAINNFSFNLQKSHLDFDKYILLADKETSQLPVSYRIFTAYYTDRHAEIIGEAEYIVLKDMFDQFNMFKLHVGDIYSAEEYRELSYRKLMGLTANTVYLQNNTSTELLTKLLARLFQHYPDIGGNKDNSLWQSIRDLVGDKETLEEIYKLLYHAYPCEPNGPQSKKLKIDF